MDPVELKILSIPGYFYLWLLTIISLTFFVTRTYKIINILKKAKPENRLDNYSKRTYNFIRYVLGQKKLFGERSIGLPHFFFFWGFVFYATTFWWNLIRGLVPVIPIPYADEVGIVGLILEISGVLVLISIIIAVIRRTFFPPPHLQKSRDAVIILSLITILMVTLLIAQGAKGTIEQSSLSPAGTVIATFFAGMPISGAHNLYSAMWWIHIIAVLFFLAYIPYSKHLHLLTSPVNAFLLNDDSPANLTIKGGTEEITQGSSKWDEFTWKQVFQTLTCAECGRCDRVCPALNSGYKLSPRSILHEMKMHLYEEAFTKEIDKIEVKSLIGGYISHEELWQCTTCMACMERCPVLNEHVTAIVQMRRYLVSQGDVEATVQDMLQKLTRYGNSFGQSDRNRAKWTNGLDFKIKDARKEEVEYLWFTGDYSAFDQRVQNLTRSTAKIFQASGLDFGILYEAEKNSGNDVRRIGEEGLFEVLKDKNIAALGKAKFKIIVTTDPHTYNTLKNEYNLDEALGAHIEVLHYTELIDELILNRKIEIKNKLNINATYHDPCYLGRYNGIFDPPRRILKAIGVNLIEMPRNKQNSYCCGAGGGKIWMEDKTKVMERPAENRINEAVALKNVKTFIVACPKDIAMFQDAIKTVGCEESMTVKDISELVLEVIG
ncbi:MAG: heterodisulfide reductase-related iron-sulfur binding cluster [Candidatus Kapabacteria bacterium]|nr:heterodisulfide reductase-related iron-sulfur binding cluster [Candidatus Kapabacteria bacterium]